MVEANGRAELGFDWGAVDGLRIVKFYQKELDVGRRS
jgi:hypothetical protein